MGDYVDLHTHTTYSDGILTPAELLEKAAKAGLAAISITDHDSIDGCIEAREFSKEYSVEIIDGIEFSCYEDGKEVHILGYNFDIYNPELQSYLAEFREKRYIRAKLIVEKLHLLDIPIEFSDIETKAGKAPIARPHIASVLNDMGVVSELKEAFWQFLAEGKPAYEPKADFTVAQALKVINRAGGVAVLAHPARYFTQDELSKIIKTGIDGIEVLHPSHDKEMINFYRKTASQYWLLATGGSDYHGNREYDDENFGKYIMPYTVVDSIKFHSGRR